jgi:hypothetical protein
MPRPLLVLNALLLAVAVGSVAYIVREVTTPPRPMPLRARPVVPETPPAPPGPAVPATPPGGFAVVASKNLFSPTRTEGPAPGVQARAAMNLPKPTLHGVVLRDGTPIAYLEDPATKRVAGYRLGDVIGGGTLKTIAADHVILTRPEGPVDVRLRDPAKPRPAAGPPSGVVPGVPSVGPGPGVPGTPMPPIGPVPPGVVPTPPQPGVQQPGQIPMPPRRMLPPNLLRRVPPGTTSDATP